MPVNHYPVPDLSRVARGYYAPRPLPARTSPRKAVRPSPAAAPAPATPAGPVELTRSATDPFLEALLVDTITEARRGEVTVHVVDDHERDRLRIKLELAVARRQLTDTQHARILIKTRPKKNLLLQEVVEEALIEEVDDSDEPADFLNMPSD